MKKTQIDLGCHHFIAVTVFFSNMCMNLRLSAMNMIQI